MKKLHSVLLAAALASGAWGAIAQTLKPGLWESHNTMTSSSGQLENVMAEAQKQLAGMPPDQRRLMEGMMTKQGVGMGAGAGTTTVKICLTPEMVKRNDIATQQGDCKQTTAPRSGNTMKFSFVCTQPPSSGEGLVTFVSPVAYTLKMALNTTAMGKPEKMKLDASARFLASECGNIKPLAQPER